MRTESNHTIDRKSIALPVLLVLSLSGIAGCDSGSLGSEVGESENTAPVAAAQILNGGGGNAFRTGAEVILTGKASEDPDGPIIDWYWEHLPGSGQQEIILKELTTSTVAFTVPNVADGTTLEFALTVTDSSGATSSEIVPIVVRAARDADRFLSMKIQGVPSDPREFFIKPRLARAIPTGAENGYSLEVEAYLVYPRIGSDADCLQFAGQPLSDGEIANRRLVAEADCLVDTQRVLTPPAGLSGAWPTDIDPSGAGSDDWFNPRHALDEPLVDVDLFNVSQFNTDERERRLDRYTVADSYTMLRINLESADPANLAGVDVIVTDAGGTEQQAVPSIDYQGGGGPLLAWVALAEVLEAQEETESPRTAAAYYDAVDPAGQRRTLNNWFCKAGFAEPASCASAPRPNGTRSAVLREEARLGTDTATEVFAHATYLNNYDLGFGRDMYTRIDENGYVWSFVNNYATLEGAVRKLDPIVAVVMEFTPAENPDGSFDVKTEPFVKFFTYAPDGSGDMRLATSMNFDGRGEISTPGNCVICHGGTDPGEVDVAVDGPDMDSTFLPWDIDSLLFVDTDPAITEAPLELDGTTLLEELLELEDFEGQLRSANQRAQIKKLNEAALATFLHDDLSDTSRTVVAQELLTTWYGGYDEESKTLDGDFDGNAVQPGWDDVNDASILPGAADAYLSVYAQNCRMCHTNAADENLQFGTHENFLEALGCIDDAGEFVETTCATVIFERGLMPSARLTMDRFWVPFDPSSGASDHSSSAALRDHLIALAGQAGRVDFSLPEGGPEARAVIALDGSQINDARRIARRDEPVRLSGRQSAFADSFEWSLDSAVAPVDPSLTGANTSEFSFVPTAPGTYPVTLSINGDAATTASSNISVINYIPTTNDVDRSTEPGGNAVDIDLFAMAVTEFVPECDAGDSDCSALPLATVASSPDDVASVSVTAEAGNNGSASLVCVDGPSLANCESGRLRYMPAGSGADTYTDQFDFVITDQDGDDSRRGGNASQISIDVLLALAATPDANTPVYSDIDRTMQLTISGGAQTTPGCSSRYRIALSDTNGPDLGRVTGLPTTSSNGTVTFAYQSDGADGSELFERSPPDENFAIEVTDCDDQTISAELDFTLRPRARFRSAVNIDVNADGSTDLTNPSVYSIVNSGTDATVNCTNVGCHDGTAGRPDFAGNMNSVYSVLTGGSSPLALPGNYTASRIYCVPVGTCPPSTDTTHDGGTGLLDASAREAMRRWLMEGTIDD